MPLPTEPVGSTAGQGFLDALRDRYLVERVIGRGGMATVYLAREVRLSRPVALKVLEAGLAVELGPERFLREVATAARLQHPHILPVFESGETAGRLWYTMPYVEGESLRGRLERTPPLALAEALRIAREAAHALHHAHQHGVVHRDVKPENILLTRDGSTLVADFGIARSSDGEPRITTAGLAVGTPMYMSPEQAGGESRVDGRSDIYSLGCVLYEMLSGEPPFTGTSPQAVAAKHLSQPAPPLRRGPPAAAAAVAKALAKSPDDRFATAADFAQALDGIVEERGRRPWPRVAVVVAALALVVAAIAVWRPGERERGGVVSAVASGFNRRMAPITSAEGVEEWPAWSPDGRRLAYVAEVDGYRQLFLRTLATGEERRVTRGPHDDIQPAWAPDGRRLAFVRASADSGKLEPADLNDWYSDGGDVWTVDLTTGAERRLVSGAFGPSWSPDGRRLAFDAAWAGARRVWVSDSAGLNPRQLTSDSSEAVVHAGPRWSPDGRRVVFRRIEKTMSDIATAEASTGATARVTEDAAFDLDPAWSPDGRRIYFSSSRGGGLNVWRVAVGADGRAAGSPEQLTTGAGDDVEPAPSPDGHRLAFAVRGLNSDLWELPVSSAGARTGDPSPLVVTSRVESRGSWSPDGATVAFNSDREGEMNLWLHDVRAGGDRRITSGPGGDYQPSWSPDGRWLAFFSARSGNSDIWTVQVADGRLSRLTSDPAMDTNPAVSPDGRQIAFLSDREGRTDVWIMQADGTGQRRASTGGAGGHFLRWTRDGRSLVFREEIGTHTRVVRLDVADGAVTPLPNVASGGHMSWSPDQSLILDVRGHKTLFVYPVSGAPPRRVFEFDDPDVRIDYPVWSPDGRHILFDRAAPHGGDLWVLDGMP